MSKEVNTDGFKIRDPRIKDSPSFNKRDPRIREPQRNESQQHTSAPLVAPLVPPPIPSFSVHPSLASSPFNSSLQSSNIHSFVPPPFPPPKTTPTHPILPATDTQQNFPSFSTRVPPPRQQLPITHTEIIAPNISTQFHQLNQPPPNMRQNSPSLKNSQIVSPSFNRLPITPSDIIPPPPIPAFFLPPPMNSTPFLAQTFQSAGSCDSQRALRAPVLLPAQQSEPPIFEKSSSQDWVDNWLKTREITIGKERSPKEPKIKICELKGRFITAYRLIRELENAASTLNVMAKAVTPSEWDQKCAEVEVKMEQLTNVIKQLQMTPEEMSSLKKKYEKRIKKRKRLKRQAERLKKKKEEAKISSQNLHIHIDNWQKEMQEEVERVYREDRLAREADAVLFEVTHKKAEARRQLALLAALRELRKVRDQRLVTTVNQLTSQAQLDTFNAVIDRLESMWEDSMAECALEEQVLRGMLNDAIIKSDPVKRFKKLVINEWEAAIFGVLGSLDGAGQPSLVQTRCEWDSFVAKPLAVLASTIPPGYVLPVPPSDDEWHTLLKYQP